MAAKANRKANGKAKKNGALRVLVVGVGNMGASHARAYDKIDGFELAGLCARRIAKRTDLPARWSNVPRFADYGEALETLKPDVVSINTWPDTHADYAIRAFKTGAHVFMEKPIAETVKDAKRVVAAARDADKKLAIGYILRVHPSWVRFVELAKGLGKPLVMRMNLNQQSIGDAWTWHKNLMKSLPPIVDCGVHYVDVMCQMTGAKPVRVHGIGAHLTKEVKTYNYGHLHVEFDDGSVGWYEAGWGPMMSEIAFFVKDVVGPKGCASIVMAEQGKGAGEGASDTASADIDTHTKTNAIRLHHSKLNKDNSLAKADELFRMDDEPSHDELCEREQLVLLNAIRRNVDLSDHMEDAVNSLRIVLAADESVRKKKVVTLR
ncbi:Predicted dehydrogenase [Rhizobiales bacterium GAS113]|nr:Predicted dehydrogenase [Rhizobiales bacterium GAS113]